jgi:hypothetical protein
MIKKTGQELSIEGKRYIEVAVPNLLSDLGILAFKGIGIPPIGELRKFGYRFLHAISSVYSSSMPDVENADLIIFVNSLEEPPPYNMQGEIPSNIKIAFKNVAGKSE